MDALPRDFKRLSARTSKATPMLIAQLPPRRQKTSPEPDGLSRTPHNPKRSAQPQSFTIPWPVFNCLVANCSRAEVSSDEVDDRASTASRHRSGPAGAMTAASGLNQSRAGPADPKPPNLDFSRSCSAYVRRNPCLERRLPGDFHVTATPATERRRRRRSRVGRARDVTNAVLPELRSRTGRPSTLGSSLGSALLERGTSWG